MAEILFANNSGTQIASSIGSGATTVSLAPGTGAEFPSPGANQYYVATFVDAATGLINEIVHVTNMTGDVATIVRAQEGTTALSWSAGDFFSMFMTAGVASAYLQQGQSQQQATNYAVDIGTANTLVVTLSPAPTDLSGLIGAPIRVLVANTSTSTTPTLNVNSLGAQPIRAVVSAGVTQIAVGTLAIGKIVEFIWDGTQFQYNGIVEAATTTQIKAGSAGLQPVTPANLLAAYPFNADTGSNGRITLPGGFQYLWGNSLSTGAASVTITFANAFVTTFPRMTVTSTESSGALPAAPIIVTITSTLMTSFTVHGTVWDNVTQQFADASGGFTFHWHAIGQGA